MYALTKQSLVIALAAMFGVMMGHIVLDTVSGHVADSSSDFIGKSSVAINK